MRIFLAALFMVLPCVLSHAYTDAERLDLARTLIRRSIPEDSDNLMSGMAPIGFEGFTTTNAFFSMSVGGLPDNPSDRRTSFDFYLNHMASENRSALRTPEDDELSLLAVDQCVRMGYTNEIVALRRIAVGTEHPLRHQAIASVVRLGGLGCGGVDFVVQIGTNSVSFSQRERNAAWRELSKDIRTRLESNSLSDQQREQLVRLIYGLHISDWPGIVSIDDILCACNEDYGSSSNRYDTISRVLARPGLPVRLNAYFSNLTNKLMKATQPLPEVEALRGL